METTVKERLIRFLKYVGISQRQFEKRIGLGNGYVTNMTGTIGADKLLKIGVEYPQLSLTWLVLGEGEMLKDGEAVENRNESPKENLDSLSRLVSIMEKDHELLREIMEKKDETIDRLLSIIEAREGIDSSTKKAVG